MCATTVTIRPAEQHDFQWVKELMQDALNKYYGGDHHAHAIRIFNAHIQGGRDLIGFFSFEQRMFVADIKGQPAGIIHLVGKKQSTYKISPLIVDPHFCGKYGVGKLLLSHGEEYARANGSRQLYCTVAQSNFAAMQFFLRHGFIQAGYSESHYKIGVTEYMLYKPLVSDTELKQADDNHISVVPFSDASETMRREVRDMLLRQLPSSFEGIDDNWVSALFSGYDRRDTRDVNAKFKLIFVATDNTGKAIGVAGATPKKGSPIKIMPLLAEYDAAFEALLVDIPHQLAEFGHKLYVHCNPTADQVMHLQRLGWHLDAAMPSAYRPGVVTQQWGLDLDAGLMRTMRIKEKFLDLIRTRKKDLEVRVGYETIKKINVGERIRLYAHTNHLDVKVASIRTYSTFANMLQHEPYNRIAPDLTTSTDVHALLRKFYTEKKESLGVYVLHFELI